MEVEDFENIEELFSEIMYLGISKLIKRGLKKEYIAFNEELSTIKGKINIYESINHQVHLKHKLICSNDKYTINNYMNQILKTTLIYLLKTEISSERKIKVKNILRYFDNVDILDYRTIYWNISYNRNNQTYPLLINISHMFFNDLLLTQEYGKIKLRKFEDSINMYKLYEKFILEYYKREHPELKVTSSYIKWQLDDDYDLMLPTMKSDINLSQDNNVLIIDAKYYQHTLQEYYDNKSIYSNNLYQIFTYVKNKEAELKNVEHKVSGMLLYAKTDEDLYPNSTYSMSGNKISAKTLDLNQDFSNIKKQLDEIVKEYFNNLK